MKQPFSEPKRRHSLSAADKVTPPRLFLCGGGHSALPIGLVRVASYREFHRVTLDDLGRIVPCCKWWKRPRGVLLARCVQ